MTGGFETPIWRAIAVYRWAALAYVAVLVIRNDHIYLRPWAAWPALAVMAGWTVLTTFAYANPARRRTALLSADLALAIALLAGSVVIVGRPALKIGTATLTVPWHVAPILAWAVARGRRGGIAAALLMGATDLTVRAHYDQSAFTGAVLMLLAAGATGYLVRRAAVAQERLEAAVQLEAATRERERLARDIHDSVLQVLALVKRRGAGLDGEAGELARLAGEQEAALRALVAGGQAVAGDGDLMALLRAYASEGVSIAGPAGPIGVPPAAGRELVAAVAAALDNVTRHCPAGTKAFVLVEQEAETVIVTVRDDGPGMFPDRLARAAEQGRLGVAQSIRGRVADLGGHVRITSAPGDGTEVEMTIPIRLAP